MTRSQWKSARVMAVVGVLAAALGGVSVAQTPAPGLGTWKLNLAKSKYSPTPAPKSATVTYSTAGQGVKAVIDGIGPDGSKTHWEYTANFDGKPYPVTGTPADGKTLTVTTLGTNAQGQKVNNVQVFEKS
jgi:hypothetical protein